ncbi:hypothetical protein AB5J49_19260 [Streptomyces sp. R28]|uniref:DUF916 domain-containing protein n=1 Tax=Streptomyces sp. R28 TaxID=3238628 RepID=A0AB39PZR2_9ACTN
MSSAVRVLCLSLLSLLALPAATPTATAAEGWSVAPSGGGRPSFYAEGEPGAVLQDTVSVTNGSGRSVGVRLRATGVPVTFAEREVRIPARTRADVPFSVTVPDGDGTAEIVALGTDGRTQRLRVHLRASVAQVAALTVEQVSVRADGITYELVNRGTTPLVPRLSVQVRGVFGPVLDRGPRTLSVDLPPGSRTKLTEPWPDRPVLDAVDVRLTVTAAGGASDTAAVSVRFVPWATLAGGAAVIGALFVVRHRRRRTTTADESAERPHSQAELTGAGT